MNFERWSVDRATPDVVQRQTRRFMLDDFRPAPKALMKRGRAETIVMKVSTVVANWREYADKAGVEAGSDTGEFAVRVGTQMKTFIYTGFQSGPNRSLFPL